MSFTARTEHERREQFAETMLRGATRIFRPEIYDKVFPPSPVEQALRSSLDDEGEEITPDDFDSIDQFIKGLGNIKSSTLADHEGWV